MENCTVFSGRVLDIPRRTVTPSRITVRNGIIRDIRPVDDLPDSAPYILPGFVDAHCHIESTMLLPESYAGVAVTHGTVAVMADPHEIANVLGTEGVDFMIANARKVRLHICIAAPSCVASSWMETSGATLDAPVIARLMERGEITHLGEMMNYPGVLSQDRDVMGKIQAALKAHKPVDGHAPGLLGEDLSRYVSSGISTDHECSTLEEALERIRLGMRVEIRQGSAARDYPALAPLIRDHASSLMFCTDDLHVNHLIHGHINLIVRQALRDGYDLWRVLEAACWNPVRHYGIGVGLLRPGDAADFIMVGSLEEMDVLTTVLEGHVVYQKRTGLIPSELYREDAASDGGIPNRFEAARILASDLEVKVPQGDDLMRVIHCRDGCLVSRKRLKSVRTISDVSSDILKMMVMSRYSPQARPQVGFITGLGLRKGAIAQSIAHDCHNIVAVGCSDEDIVAAVNRLVDLRGGIVCHVDGKDLCLGLDCAGLMSSGNPQDISRRFEELLDMVTQMGSPLHDPFMTLSFMALPVIPHLKLTDRGLFDGDRFAFTSLTLRDEVLFRKASSEDLPLIGALAATAFPATYRELLSPGQLDYMMEWMYSPESLRMQTTQQGHVYFICEALDADSLERVPAGYISYQRESEDLFHLQKIYLLPSFQGRGIGKRMFLHLLDQLRRIHPRPFDIELNVNRQNRARFFYEHMGMAIRRQGDFDIGQGYQMNDYIMGMTVS